MSRPVSETFFEFLDEPIRGRTRPLLVLFAVALFVSFAFPLWRISMKAPQYPKGLYIDVYAYTVEGGNEGHDIQEINTLNHYIGMKTITKDELRDIEWIPFALGALGLLTLRAALIGNVRSLVDLSVLTTYVSAVAFGRFVYMLWFFGHHLDPHAPVKTAPFMPVVIGGKQVANFMTWSYPQWGSLFVAVFAAGLVLVTLWHLWTGRRRAALAGYERLRG
jgi:hypothetical protein